MNRLYCILFIIGLNFSFSQNDSIFFIERLNVQKEYVPDIKSVVKRYNQPIYIDSIKNDKKQVNYSFQEKFDFSFSEKIDIKRVPKMSRLYNPGTNNSLLFGIGQRDMFQIDFIFNELFNFQKDFGVCLSHYSKNFFVLNNLIKNKDGYNSHKYISIDGFSNTNFSIFMKQKISNFELSSSFDLFAQNGLYYGGAGEADLDSISAFSNLGVDLDFIFSNLNIDRGLLDFLEFKYSYFTKRNIRAQGYLDMNSKFSYDFGSLDLDLDLNLDVVNNQLLLNPDFPFTNFVQQSSSTYFEYFNKNLSFFGSVAPCLKILNQSLGFSYNWVNNQTSHKFYFFPYVNLYNKKYNLSFKYHGYLKSYLFSNLATEIPYLTSFFQDHLSRKKLYQVSLEDKFDYNFSYNISFTYLHEKDFLVPFLLPDSNSIGSPIGMYFDDLKELKLKLNLSYSNSDIETFFNINISSMNSLLYDNVQYIPRFYFEYFFQIKPIEKILLSFDITYSSKRDVLDPESSFDILIGRELNNFFLLNFDIKYQLSNYFKFNVGIKNLMDFQYEIFDGYYFERDRRFFMSMTYSF